MTELGRENILHPHQKILGIFFLVSGNLIYFYSYLLQGAGYDIKSYQHSAFQKSPTFFIEPEVSFPCAQNPAIGTYPEPAE
jgi:hypothetical protein